MRTQRHGAITLPDTHTLEYDNDDFGLMTTTDHQISNTHTFIYNLHLDRSAVGFHCSSLIVVVTLNAIDDEENVQSFCLCGFFERLERETDPIGHFPHG